MAATETAIVNLALCKMGEQAISDIDGTDVDSVKCNLIFDQCRDELLISGPKRGWKFATMTYHGIDRNSTSITAFADYSGTVSGTTSVTSTAHGLVSGDMVTIDDTTNYDGDYDVVRIDANTFYIDEDYVADDATGTAYWTSERYEYRFAVPTCKEVVGVYVNGAELPDWVRKGSYIYTNTESSEVDMMIVQAITDVTLFPDWFVKVLVLKLAIELHYNITQDLKAIQLLAQEYDYAMNKAIAADESEKYVQEGSSSWADMGNKTNTIE